MSQGSILVTGAGGYIGSITADLLLQYGYCVVAVDNFSRGYRQPLEYLQSKYPNKLQIVKLDLSTQDLNSLFMNFDFDVVVHFAALLDVGESWKIPETYFRNNVGGFVKLIEAMQKHSVKRLIFSSSCTVYGDAQYTPIDETHPVVSPVTPYGASKQLCEQVLAWQKNIDHIDYISFRYFNVCGASLDGELGDSKKPSFHLVQNAVRGALNIAEFKLNYAAVNTPDGSPIRDYVNVVDLARAHVMGIDYLRCHPACHEVFNLGTGTGNSVLEIVDVVKKITRSDFPVSDAKERRVGEADKMIADISKAKEILKWQPKYSLEDSVKSLMRWYKKHPHGWEY